MVFARAVVAAGATLAALAVLAAPTDPFFPKAWKAVSADVAEMQGIACMASTERVRYAPRTPRTGATCAELIAASSGSRGVSERRDRIRLDVTAGGAGERLSLTNASRFEQPDLTGLVQAATAQAGGFSDFLRYVSTRSPDGFEIAGRQSTPLGQLYGIGFIFPSTANDLPGAAGEAARKGFRGSLYALPDSGDVRRLSIDALDIGGSCRVQYSIDYAATRVGDRQLVLPQVAVIDSIERSGAEVHSETYYSGCRRSPPETTPAAIQLPTRPLPSKTRLKIRIEPGINGATAADGDPLIGIIRSSVKDKTGYIVKAGDRVHGRIALLEQVADPRPKWNLIILWQTIERGVGENGIDQGVEQPVVLKPLNDGDRTGIMNESTLLALRPEGGGYYTFGGTTLDLNDFESDWEVR